MAGQPQPGAMTPYTFDVSNLTIFESGTTQPPTTIVDKGDNISITATCVFGGAGAAGIVALLAAAGVGLRMSVKVEGWGNEPEGEFPPVTVPLAAGVTTYSVPLAHSMPASFMTPGLYELKAAVTLTGVGATLGIAGYNSIPTLQVIASAP
jgi:hypothetical protein